MYNAFGKKERKNVKKVPKRQTMVGESNQNVLLIQIDTSRYAEFENQSSIYRDSTVLETT